MDYVKIFPFALIALILLKHVARVARCIKQGDKKGLIVRIITLVVCLIVALLMLPNLLTYL